MEDYLVEWRKHQNLKPLKLNNKEKYYHDLINIEHSWSGRMDTNVHNTFIMEAEQQLINAIELFEMGYFDCAYYSLRSAIDISTTMVFLSDLPNDEKERYLNDWKKVKPFPLRNEMLKKLARDGSIFIDMFEKMPIFFNQAKDLSEKLNKYVHKQGLRHFYVARNHPINGNKSQEMFINNFEAHLKECIGIVAIMRLAIDPFPILLMDEEILYRCFDSMTEPYSEDFVNEYIGAEILKEYKSTDYYSSTRQLFESEEKKNEAIFSIIKHQYIDTKKFNDIFKQFHLLPMYDAISTLIVYICSKVTKVYTCDGLMMYFTDRNTNRTKMSWDSRDFKNFQNAQEKINQQYDEVFISVFKFKNDYYFVEHNELLENEDIAKILGFVAGALSKTEN
ncbi:MAG: hypothetical protein NC311_11060 [Muribaculaceae bacterium]|nr:hypothetical protein [Muribaculaceae bacterium]